MLLDFCTIPRLLIMNTLFKHKVASTFTFYKSTVCQRSMISFVIASLDLWLMLWNLRKDRLKAIDWSSLGGEL